VTIHRVRRWQGKLASGADDRDEHASSPKLIVPVREKGLDVPARPFLGMQSAIDSPCGRSAACCQQLAARRCWEGGGLGGALLALA
jgi:hypothetical protein